MRHRGWFTLVIRATGLVVILFAISPMVGHATLLIGLLLDNTTNADHPLRFIPVQGGFGTPSLGPALISALPTAIQLACGLYLVFAGRRLIDRFLREAERIESGADTLPTQKR